MSLDTDALPTELRLGLDWELWVVEQLLFTGKRDDLVETLVGQGIAPDVARERVAEILASDGFARLRHRLGEATLASRLQRLELALHAERAIPVRDDIDAEALLREHWIPSRPLLLRTAARDLRAVRDWTFAGLAARFADATVEVNVDRGQAHKASETEQVAAPMPFPELVDRVQGAPSDDFYVVSRNGLLASPAFAPMWGDLAPLPSFLVPPTPPQGVSLWLGPAGTVTPPHFDPHNVLLVQVQGTKRIRLAPRLRSARHAELDGYYLASPLDRVFDADRIHTVVLEAGEALFVPVGWFHEVTALSPSMTLSFLCFPWPNHFHWLGPPGSDDAR